MKECSSCNQTLDEMCFSKNRARKDGLADHCKPCQKAYQDKWYAANKDKQIAKVNINKQLHTERNHKFVLDYLRIHPCVDCGESNPIFLDFDHIENKDDSISVLIQMPSSVERIRQEITKCEVRCVKCHRFMTAKRGRQYRYIALYGDI